MNLTLAVDFTDTINHEDRESLSVYNKSLVDFASMIEPYNRDKDFALYCIGGHAPNHETSIASQHCYPMNNDNKFPFI